jgi:hypothetical protein
MDDLSQYDTSTQCNFGQHMAVAFCPILILISVAFFWLERDSSMRFLAYKGTVT